MKSDSKKFMIVDDDEEILHAFQEVLKKEGYHGTVARSGQEALKKISTEKPDVVFMDIAMPKLNGLEVLNELKQRNHDMPVILITGYGTMQTAVKAMQLGAFEYLTKPVDIDKVRQVAKRALLSRQTGTTFERTILKAEFSDRYEIVGQSKQMLEVYKLIGSISTTPNHTSVLILGESGTGKELVARAIHTYSHQGSEPFVGINCTGLPETLLESELFGHERGAFTGAVERKLGKFEVAGSGTIFLDEIGSLSSTLQQKLLRVVQERELEHLGGNQSIRVTARFIAATNRDLTEAVQDGSFREDLFFRLNVVTITLPPLRERRDDIPVLANYFLSKYNERLKKSITGYSREAMDRLMTYSFPGNVRELENLIERQVMLTNGNCILADTLGDIALLASSAPERMPFTSLVFAKARDKILRRFEKQFLKKLLTVHRGNVTAAARASKMTRQNFQRLMKKHKISSTSFR